MPPRKPPSKLPPATPTWDLSAILEIQDGTSLQIYAARDGVILPKGLPELIEGPIVRLGGCTTKAPTSLVFGNPATAI